MSEQPKDSANNASRVDIVVAAAAAMFFMLVALVVLLTLRPSEEPDESLVLVASTNGPRHLTFEWEASGAPTVHARFVPEHAATSANESIVMFAPEAPPGQAELHVTVNSSLIDKNVAPVVQFSKSAIAPSDEPSALLEADITQLLRLSVATPPGASQGSYDARLLQQVTRHSTHYGAARYLLFRQLQIEKEAGTASVTLGGTTMTVEAALREIGNDDSAWKLLGFSPIEAPKEVWLWNAVGAMVRMEANLQRGTLPGKPWRYAGQSLDDKFVNSKRWNTSLNIRPYAELCTLLHMHVAKARNGHMNFDSLFTNAPTCSFKPDVLPNDLETGLLLQTLRRELSVLHDLSSDIAIDFTVIWGSRERIQRTGTRVLNIEDFGRRIPVATIELYEGESQPKVNFLWTEK